MPTYEYRCPECGNEFEKFGRMSDPPVQECPHCHAQAQRKISGGAGLVFKGSGFYITDYRGDGYKKAAESDKGGGSSSSGSGESKPAPKSESSSSGGSSSGGSSTSE
ncbi:zinc ribbon domain-containing protein [Longimicrobium sp.]|uniref:FmdB family zinc ribbon protein n=1 Tax=Longimicrobium sp. TaxID=2029185 RepID=UPI002E322295|nr:zinc ribbon domain-containing protein [Longimicrobium sp.]HEX6040434.1 zinc ribbon domain-containing protein [Longimicrobium sp.]